MAAVSRDAGTPDHLAFEQTWKAVEPELRRWLARRRVPAADRDDYVQEVAARVLVSPVPLHSFGDVMRWSMAVLRNLHIDRVRSERRRPPCDEAGLDDQFVGPAAVDVARQVVARLDLAVVAEEMSSWSADQRRTLLHDEASGTRRSSAFYVARHRLRSRLLAAIDGAAAFWAGIWRRIEPADVDRTTAAAVLIPPAAIACIVSFTLLDGRGGAAGPQPAAGPPISRAAAAPATGLPDGLVVASYQPPGAGVQLDAARPEAASPRSGARDGQSPDLVPPVDERVEVDGPGDPYVQVESEHPIEPLFCLSGPGLPPGLCVDDPRYPTDQPG